MTARLLTAALALSLALPAAAPAAGTRAGDRADARAFAKATQRAKAAVWSHLPEFQPLADAWNSEKCTTAIEGAPSGDASLAALEFAFDFIFEAAFYPAREDLRRFAGQLDRIEVRDPVLKAGRAGWRVQIRAAQQFQPAPADVCERLDAWRQAGYPPDQAPTIADPGLDALEAAGDAAGKKIERAGKRMRKLGVKPSVAKLWGGIGFLASG
jgi:hypothetical protein